MCKIDRCRASFRNDSQWHREFSENIALQTYRAQATRDVGEVFAEP
jgi:hypothetical protein